MNKQLGPEAPICGLGSTPDMLLCCGCNKAYYCCLKCQKEDWTEHRTQCRQQQRLAAKLSSSSSSSHSSSSSRSSSDSSETKKTDRPLQPGDAVTVHGLKGAPQHNGVRGIIQEFNGENGRFVVKLLAAEEKILAIRPGNL